MLVTLRFGLASENFGNMKFGLASVDVGNVKNQSFDLLRKADPAEQEKKGTTSKASQNLMANWLKRSSDSEAPSTQPFKKK